jgi:hypothetical protein
MCLPHTLRPLNVVLVLRLAQHFTLSPDCPEMTAQDPNLLKPFPGGLLPVGAKE